MCIRDSISGASVITGSPQSIGTTSNPALGSYRIQFQNTTGHVVGDRWSISVRAELVSGSRTLGNGALTDIDTGWGPKGSMVKGGWAAFPDWTFGISPVTGNADNNTTGIDRPIFAGAQISLDIYETNPRGPNKGPIVTPTQDFTSSTNYANIEERYYEDGIYKNFVQHDVKGVDVGSRNVLFRRCYDWRVNQAPGIGVNGIRLADNPLNPVRMIIQGEGLTDRSPKISSDEVSLNLSLIHI